MPLSAYFAFLPPAVFIFAFRVFTPTMPSPPVATAAIYVAPLMMPAFAHDATFRLLISRQRRPAQRARSMQRQRSGRQPQRAQCASVASSALC
jgi:hypothetical protein